MRATGVTRRIDLCRAELKETMEPTAFRERYTKFTARQGEIQLLPFWGTTNEEVVRQILLQERTVKKRPPRIPGCLGRGAAAAALQSARRYGHSGPPLRPRGRARGRDRLALHLARRCPVQSWPGSIFG